MRVRTNGQPHGRRAGLRERFEEHRREIVEELDRLREIPAAEAVKDLQDQAVEDLTRETQFALAEIGSEALHGIDRAIGRLEDSSYGLCADCGSRIEKARLKALPAAPLCHRCQADREAAATHHVTAAHFAPVSRGRAHERHG